MREIGKKIVKRLCYGGYLNWMPDSMYLKLLFRAHMGRKLDLRKPQTFNEKLQWLKIHDRNKFYTEVVDKYAVKKYIENKIGDEYNVKLLGVWDSFDEIDFSVLPEKFVLKCTHDSGGLVICTDKNKLDYVSAKAKIEKSLRTNYFYSSREWPYKNVLPRIIAEEFIGVNGKVPEDYKFFTFDGKIDCVMVCRGRDQGHLWFYFYDMNWERLIYQHAELEKNDEIAKPANFEKMRKVAEELAGDFKQARIDLYNIEGKVYFGEITLFNQSGFDTDITYKTDLMWGKKLELPQGK